MARIRSIKPDFFRHEGLQDLESAHPGSYAMLVFAALWGHCDKAGRFEWKPRTLKLDILPFISYELATTLALLEQAGFVRRYTHEGKTYGEVVNFEKHQRIGGKESQEAAKHPEPTEYEQGSTGEAPVKQLGLQEGKGREEEGKRKGVGANGSRFALTQLPAEWVSFAATERPDLDPDALFAKFGDYWRGVVGSKGRKCDWDATWRNFVRTERRQPEWAKPKQSPEQVAAEAMRMMEERDAQARTA